MFIFNSKLVGTLNIIIASIFVTRTLYDLLAFTYPFIQISVPTANDEDLTLLSFSVYFLWEFVPTVLLLMTLARPMDENRSISR